MSNDQVEGALFHLGYEWWMFRASFELLSTLARQDDPARDDDPVRNALVESLAIHGRGLAQFFHREPQDRSDWTALHLGVPITLMPPALHEWCWNVNKRVAHITRDRQNPLTHWDASTARGLLVERVKTVRKTLGTRMPQDWIGDRATVSPLLGGGPKGPSRPPSDAIGATGPAGPPGPRRF